MVLTGEGVAPRLFAASLVVTTLAVVGGIGASVSPRALAVAILAAVLCALMLIWPAAGPYMLLVAVLLSPQNLGLDVQQLQVLVTPSRALLVLASAAVLLRLIIKNDFARLRSPLAAYLALYFLAFTLSRIGALDPRYSASRYFQTILEVSVPYFVVLYGMQTTKQIRRFVSVLTVGLAILSVLGIVEALTGWNVAESIPFSAREGLSHVGPLRAGILAGVRVSSINPAGFGIVLAAILPYAGARAYMSQSAGKRVFYWTIVVLASVALILTLNRTAWLSAFVMGLVVLGVVRRAKYVLVALVALLVASTAVALGPKESPVIHSVVSVMDWTGRSSPDAILPGRIWAITTALVMVHGHWPFGVGSVAWGSLAQALLVDNLYVTLVVETGVFGVLSWLLLVGAAVHRTAGAYHVFPNTRTAPLLLASLASMIGMATSGLGNAMLQTSQVSIVMWCIMGLAMRICLVSRRSLEPDVQEA